MQIKANCDVCHQLGNQATREIPAALGKFAPTVEAWDRRVQTRQDGRGMSSAVTVLGRARGLEMFANWTARITAGGVPPVAPPRPQGFERNLVRVLTGAAAKNGQHCREGWTMYPVPGPHFTGVRGDVAADLQYYNVVDRGRG
jgi:hypothetical protein